MKNKLIFIFVVLLDLNVFSQLHCNDIFYNADSLVVINDELYSGYCDSFNKNGKIQSKFYYGYGVLDSIVYFDKNGLIESIEPIRNEMTNGTVKSYYKNGTLHLSIGFKNNKYFGFYREYYKNGKIKSETEYIADQQIKDNTWYEWTKKGVKYLYKDNSHTKTFGKFFMFYSGRPKRVKIKNAT